jgi:hypothetical protein
MVGSAPKSMIDKTIAKSRAQEDLGNLEDPTAVLNQHFTLAGSDMTRTCPLMGNLGVAMRLGVTVCLTADRLLLHVEFTDVSSLERRWYSILVRPNAAPLLLSSRDSR